MSEASHADHSRFKEPGNWAQVLEAHLVRSVAPARLLIDALRSEGGSV